MYIDIYIYIHMYVFFIYWFIYIFVYVYLVYLYILFMFVYLYMYLFVYLFIDIYIYIYLSIYLLIYIYRYDISIYLFIYFCYLFMYLFIFLFIYLNICILICSSVFWENDLFLDVSRFRYRVNLVWFSLTTDQDAPFISAHDLHTILRVKKFVRAYIIWEYVFTFWRTNIDWAKRLLGISFKSFDWMDPGSSMKISGTLNASGGF